MDVILIFKFIVTFLIVFYILRRPRNLPPGPLGLPLIGSIFFLQNFKNIRPHYVLMEAAKKYGEVFSFWIGPQLVVVLHGYDAIHEALVTHADVFSGRPMNVRTFKNISEDGVLERGLIFNQYGQPWRSLRRFTLQVLRDFGVGRTSLEEKILTEVDVVTKLMEISEGTPVSIDAYTLNMMSTVILSIVFGKRYDYDDPEFLYVSRLTKAALGATGGISIGNFLPDFLVRILDKEESERNMLQFNTFKKMREFVLQQVDDHEATYDKDNIRDFIDLYIRTVREGTEEEKQALDRQNMFRIIMDLFFAGLESTSTTLNWAFLYMSEYPDIQKKCQKEIDEMFGDKTLQYADRGKLVYVEATLNEIQRCATIAPLNSTHCTTRDTVFRGYNIPKDTMILPYIWSASYDPKYWDNPDEFRPERFIDDSGKLIKNDALMTFGTELRATKVVLANSVEPTETASVGDVTSGSSPVRWRTSSQNEAVPSICQFPPEVHIVKHSLESIIDSVINIPLPYKVRMYRRA